MSEPTPPAPPAPPVPYARPQATRLAGRQLAVRIGGHRVHLGVYLGRPAVPLGGVCVLDLPVRPLRVDVDMHRAGTDYRETMKIVTTLASLALTYGVPVAEVAGALRAGIGGPAGKVEDCDGVTEAMSVPDLLGQVLLLEAKETR